MNVIKPEDFQSFVRSTATKHSLCDMGLFRSVKSDFNCPEATFYLFLLFLYRPQLTMQKKYRVCLSISKTIFGLTPLVFLRVC